MCVCVCAVVGGGRAKQKVRGVTVNLFFEVSLCTTATVENVFQIMEHELFTQFSRLSLYLYLLKMCVGVFASPSVSVSSFCSKCPGALWSMCGLEEFVSPGPGAGRQHTLYTHGR